MTEPLSVCCHHADLLVEVQELRQKIHGNGQPGLLLAAAMLMMLLGGCANVVHKRQTQTVTPLGTNTVLETESARFFFQKEAAQKISVTTRDQGGTNYSHSVSATGVQASGDVELVKAIGDAIGQGIGAAAKTSVK